MAMSRFATKSFSYWLKRVLSNIVSFGSLMFSNNFAHTNPARSFLETLLLFVDMVFIIALQRVEVKHSGKRKKGGFFVLKNGLLDQLAPLQRVEVEFFKKEAHFLLIINIALVAPF